MLSPGTFLVLTRPEEAGRSRIRGRASGRREDRSSAAMPPSGRRAAAGGDEMCVSGIPAWPAPRSKATGKSSESLDDWQVSITSGAPESGEPSCAHTGSRNRFPMPYSGRETSKMSSETFAAPKARNQTEVYAVHGADPEVLAYAMAKYSRSALSMRESLAEIGAQRAEQFLNTFYFQYGHRSIADLAHVAFAVERLSLLAAIVLVDEERWDGQERSTRYQNFMKSGWYLPDFGTDSAAARLYSETVDGLFAAYQRTSAAVLELLKRRVQRPEALKPEAYERTLKARAFDVARYLLPLATNTSLGQIVNARTLETQVSRLLSHPAAEVRDLGMKLRNAAACPAWNV